jgi:hypothetical protein
MASSGMLRRVALIRTDVSEQLSASFIRVPRIGELGTLTVTSNRRTLLVTASVPSSPIVVTLMKEALSSSETSVLLRATRHNIPQYAILHSHRRENPKFYMKDDNGSSRGVNHESSHDSPLFDVSNVKQQPPWPVVPKRTIPTDRPLLVGEI